MSLYLPETQNTVNDPSSCFSLPMFWWRCKPYFRIMSDFRKLSAVSVRSRTMFVADDIDLLTLSYKSSKNLKTMFKHFSWLCSEYLQTQIEKKNMLCFLGCAWMMMSVYIRKEYHRALSVWICARRVTHLSAKSIFIRHLLPRIWKRNSVRMVSTCN